MDALDKRILEEQEKLNRIRADLVAQEAMVAGLLEAASLRPNANVKKTTPARGGKPKGAISGEWKATLLELYKTGKPWPYNEIKSCFDHVNSKDLHIASVRDRVRSLVETGLMSGDVEIGFTVTEAAARKFKFPQIVKAPSASAQGAFNNEEPVGRERGYPPSAPEGSTPSGSTYHPNQPSFDSDLDDEVPF